MSALSPYVVVSEARPVKLYVEAQRPFRQIVELTDGTFWIIPDKVSGISYYPLSTKPISPSTPKFLQAHFFNYDP